MELSIFPTAFYGSELLLIPKTHLDSLRSQLANAILGEVNKSVSPAILVHMLPKLLGPTVFAIDLAVRRAQMFLIHAIEQDRIDFLCIAAAPSRNFQIQGPAICCGLDYHVTGVTSILCSQISQPNLLTSSSKVILDTIQWEWNEQFLVTQTERSGIGKMLPIDTAGTRNLLDHFTNAQQLVLLREAAGGFQTKAQKTKWDSEGEIVDGAIKFKTPQFIEFLSSRLSKNIVRLSSLC